MCLNCVSTAEAAIGQVAFIGYAVKDPLRRVLARRGVVGAADPVARDVRTISFLRSLDLDPVDVLGAETVAAAAAWVPQPSRQLTCWRWRSRLAASARPIGSHSLLTTA